MQDKSPGDVERFRITNFHKGVHDIDPELDMHISGRDLAGTPFIADQFRPIEDEPDIVLSRVLYLRPNEEPIEGEAILHRRIEVAKITAINLVERVKQPKSRKEKLAVAATAFVTLAAGAGLLIRRARRTHK